MTDSRETIDGGAFVRDWARTARDLEARGLRRRSRQQDGPA